MHVTFTEEKDTWSPGSHRKWHVQFHWLNHKKINKRNTKKKQKTSRTKKTIQQGGKYNKNCNKQMPKKLN